MLGAVYCETACMNRNSLWMFSLKMLSHFLTWLILFFTIFTICVYAFFKFFVVDNLLKVCPS
jgi:hypothetical protein